MHNILSDFIPASPTCDLVNAIYAAAPDPQFGAARQYLAFLFPSGSIGYLAISTADPASSKGGMLSRHFRVDDLDAAATYIVEQDRRDLNVYVSVVAHGSDLGPYKRGSKADKVCAGALWVDIDRKGPNHAARNLPETLEDLASILNDAVPVEPSCVIQSGGGWHPYWGLTTPVFLTDDVKRADFQRVIKAFQARIIDAAKARGWHVDATHDLARVLRPAGTRNHKRRGLA